MKYEDALKAWGAARLRRVYPRAKINIEKIAVQMDFNEGYACCGGSDPLCYCTFAESPSADVVVTDGTRRVIISSYDFDFVGILGEIVAAGNGSLTE